MGTFNAFVQKTVNGVSGIPVWLGVVSPRPVGGVLASAFCKEGYLIPAGCPVMYTKGAIRPFIAWEIVSASSDNKTITVKGDILGLGMMPAANDILGVATETAFTKGGTGVSSKFLSVAADSTEGQYVFTFNDAYAAGNCSAGDYVVFSTSTTAAASGKTNYAPNAYLYNDIYIDKAGANETVDYKSASGAVVDFHGEGLLIDRTVGRDFKAVLATAIPQVKQVEY